MVNNQEKITIVTDQKCISCGKPEFKIVNICGVTVCLMCLLKAKEKLVKSMEYSYYNK